MINNNFTEVKPLCYWVQHVLPLVYDDSLSFMELLGKVTKKLNELIVNNNKLPDFIAELIKDYISSGEIEKVLAEVLADYMLNVKFPPAGLTPATGDGSADDTEAIQGCIDYAFNHGGMAVYFPSGKYLTQPLTLKNKATLFGLDRYSTVLVMKGGATTAMFTGDVDELTLTGLGFDGNMDIQVNNVNLFTISVNSAIITNCLLTDGYDLLNITVNDDLQLNDVIFRHAVENALVLKGTGIVQGNNLIFKSVSALVGKNFVVMDVSKSILEQLKCYGASPNAVLINGSNNIVKMWNEQSLKAYTDNGVNNTIEVYTQSEQKQLTGSSTTNIKGDSIETIGSNKEETITGDKNVSANNLTEKIIGDKNVSANNLTEEITGDKNVSANNLTEKITDDKNVSANNLTEEITGDKNVSANNLTEEITGVKNVNANNLTEEITGDKNVSANNLTEEITCDKNVSANNLTEKITGDKNVSANNLTEEITDDKNVSANNLTEKITGDKNVSANNLTEEITDDKNVSANNSIEDLQGDKTLTASNLSETLRNKTVHINQNFTEQVDGNKYIKTLNFDLDVTNPAKYKTPSPLDENFNFIPLLGRDDNEYKILVYKNKLNFDETYDVKKYGAIGDGVTDDTQAIQNAINVCYNEHNKNNSIVFFPVGKYIISSKITVPKNITLQGVRPGSPLNLYDTTKHDIGSWLFITNTDITQPDVNSTNVGTFICEDGSKISGFGIWYPIQNDTRTSVNFINYTPTFALKGYGCEVCDLCAMNPYILIVQNYAGGRLLIHDIWAFCLKSILVTFRNSEINTIYNIVINRNILDVAYKSGSPETFINYAKTNVIAFDFKGGDWTHLYAVFCYNVYIAYLLETCERDSIIYGCRHFEFSQCGCGGSTNGIYIRGNNFDVTNCINIINCNFATTQGTKLYDGPIVALNCGCLSIIGCNFRSEQRAIIQDGSSPCFDTLINCCDFFHCASSSTTPTDIVLLFSKHCIVNNNRFYGRNNINMRGVYYNKDYVKKIIVTNNIFYDYNSSSITIREDGSSILEYGIISLNILSGTTISVTTPTNGIIENNY